MWTYYQSSGELWHDNNYISRGYAGNGEGKNNPHMQDKENIGPLPQGTYTIGNSVKHPRLGPCAIPLLPAQTNQMFGRAGFYIHGDSLSNPGTASEGCIILSAPERMLIASSPDRTLKVLP